MNETLPHAVQRMRAQGFDDKHIAGQIHRWHVTWTPAQIHAALNSTTGAGALAAATHGTASYDRAPMMRPEDIAAAHKIKPMIPFIANPRNIDTSIGLIAGIKPSTVYRAARHPVRAVEHLNHFRKVATPQEKADSAVGAHIIGGILGAPAARAIERSAVKGGKTTAFISGGGKRPTKLPEEAEQLRAVLSGRAAKEAAKEMGSYEKAGAKMDPLFGKSAKQAYKAEEKLRSEERIARLTEANKRLHDKSLEPEERIRAWKDEMAGELPKVNWGGFKELDGNAVKAMTRYVLDEAPNLHDTQRVKVVTALQNALEGITPRPHELLLIEHVFGKDAASGFSQMAQNPLRETIVGVLNVPRTLMASLDFSAPLRQGLTIGTRHPIIALKNFPAMFKAFGSEKYFQHLGEEIKSRPTYPLMLDADLPLTGLDRGVGQAEEAFAGLNVAEKITGGKRFSPVRMSDRAYTGYLDKLRADVFDVLIRQAQSAGKDVHDDKFLHDLGHFIGNATGRGTFDSKALEQAMPLLNIGLFSPRLIASRVQLLNPYYYYRLDPFVRKQALTSALSMYGSILTVLGLAAAAGAKVETNWRSANFGKIRIGDTRIDIAGGFQQYWHLLGEIITREKMSSTTGEITSLTHPKFGQPSLLDTGVSFLRSKAGPIPGMIADYATGESGIGQEYSTWKEIKGHFLPLITQDVNDLRKHPFHGMNGIEAALAGYVITTFGTGMQTYQDPAAKGSSSDDPFFGSGGGDSPGSDPFFGP